MKQLFTVLSLLLMFVPLCFASEGEARDEGGLLFSFESAFEDIYAVQENGGPVFGYTLTPVDNMQTDHSGGLQLRHGSAITENLSDSFARHFRDTKSFSLELLIVPTATNPQGPTHILSFSGESERANFILGQQNNDLVAHLGESTTVKGVTLVKGEPAYLSITYASGQLSFYKNGVLVETHKIPPINWDQWQPQPLLLGGGWDQSQDWEGLLASLKIYDRPLSAEEVRYHFKESQKKIQARPTVPLLELKGRLVATSAIPSIQELSPYTQSLVVYQYQIEEVLQGSYVDDQIYVAHWSVLDNQHTLIQDSQVGQSYWLKVEAFSDNPQLAGENLSDNVVEDFTLPYYFDVSNYAVLDNSKPFESPEITSGKVSSPEFIITPEDRVRRAEMISNHKAKILAQVDSLGGWEQWEKQLSPFRKELAHLISKSWPSDSNVMVGRDNFLFSRGRVSYLLARDLVEKGTAFDAIKSMDSQLRKRGIDLIIVPVPTRAELYPENLPVSVPLDLPVAPQRLKFIDRLLDEGIEVVDLLPAFLDQKKLEGPPLAMLDDPHWSSRGIEVAARVIAERLKRYSYVQSSGTPADFTSKEHLQERQGALFREMNSAQQKKYVSQPARVVEVLTNGNNRYRNPEKSPILVAGDSYTAMFAREGGSIGAHLAKEIGLPVATMSENGGGPMVPRALTKEGASFIDEHRIVIWLFTSRYLMPKRTWEIVELP